MLVSFYVSPSISFLTIMGRRRRTILMRANSQRQDDDEAFFRQCIFPEEGRGHHTSASWKGEFGSAHLT